MPAASSPSALKIGLPGKHAFFALETRYVNDYCMNQTSNDILGS